MKIKVSLKDKKFSIKVKELTNFGCFFGLMFKSRNSENLLFNLPGKWGIHSFFVFFPFLAIWLDEKNKIIEWKVVNPFSFYIKPQRKFSKLIEIPLNEANKRRLSYFPSIKRKI
ncbi:MAG: hypothetical protein QXS38_00635 [Candidatus Pacearchaeota archaeon]